MYAQGGANFVPIAVPEICWYTLVSNSKKLFFKTSFAILIRFSVGISLRVLWSKASLSALKPDSWVMLGYNPTTSAVNCRASLGISMFLILLLKSLESLTHEAPFCLTLSR